MRSIGLHGQDHAFGLGELLQFLHCLRVISHRLSGKALDLIILRFADGKFSGLNFSPIGISQITHHWLI